VCIIIDACVASRVLISEADEDYGLVREAILCGRNPIVYGGKLRKEYLKIAQVARMVKVLDQAGLAKSISDVEVDAQDMKLQENASCRSNDTHVIALALVSGARLLCSADQGLHEDFTDPGLVSTPRGKVFQRADHVHLLRKPCSGC
jgi:hypothetical protein